MSTLLTGYGEATDRDVFGGLPYSRHILDPAFWQQREAEGWFSDSLTWLDE